MTSRVYRLERAPSRDVLPEGPMPLVTVARLAGGLRAPAFAVATCGTSALAHVAAGGQAPPTVLLAVLFAGCWLGHRAQVRAELSAGQLLAAIGALQVVIHVLLAGTHHSHLHQSHVQHAPADQVAPGITMLLAHAVADVLVVAWLRHGERLAARLAARLLRRVLCLPDSPLPVTLRRPSPPTCHQIAPRWTRLAALVVPRRGPPLTV